MDLEPSPQLKLDKRESVHLRPSGYQGGEGDRTGGEGWKLRKEGKTGEIKVSMIKNEC